MLYTTDANHVNNSPYIIVVIILWHKMSQMTVTNKTPPEPKGKGNRITVNITVSRVLFHRIEKARGRVARSVFISDLIADHFKMPEAKI